MSNNYLKDVTPKTLVYNTLSGDACCKTQQTSLYNKLDINNLIATI